MALPRSEFTVKERSICAIPTPLALQTWPFRLARLEINRLPEIGTAMEWIRLVYIAVRQERSTFATTTLPDLPK